MPGMIPISWIVTGVIALGAVGYILHCEHIKKNQTIAAEQAKAQLKANALQALRDLKNKEHADEDYKRRISRLAADVKRLRESSASILPAPSPGTADPDRIAFSRAELDAALRVYREGVLGLVEQGGKAVEGLDEAREWARGR